MLKPQPYLLKNIIQHYAWGTKDKNAFIPKLLNIKAEKDKPYAELWMGAHPKASSQIVIDGKEVDLAEVIRQYPREMLGSKTAKRFSNILPFLFKVLSAKEALSIQVHPNKKQAIALNKKDPINYPDSNQKHEIAIALDSLTALVGFKPLKELIKTLRAYAEIADLAGIINNSEKKNFAKKIVTRVFNIAASDNEVLSNVIQKLYNRISRKKSKNEIEKHFLTLIKRYPDDVGLILMFFLNLIKLKKGEAIFTKPGVPHAYLKGNILECMSNSDNVIRAGLTPKYKDFNSLLKVTAYDLEKPIIIKGTKQKNSMLYRTIAREFEIQIFTSNKNELNFKNQIGPRIIFILEGQLKFEFNDGYSNQSKLFSKGESFFLPSILSNYKVSSSGKCHFVIVSVPA